LVRHGVDDAAPREAVDRERCDAEVVELAGPTLLDRHDAAGAVQLDDGGIGRATDRRKAQQRRPSCARTVELSGQHVLVGKRERFEHVQLHLGRLRLHAGQGGRCGQQRDRESRHLDLLVAPGPGMIVLTRPRFPDLF
jgi:hypothetical protein